MASKRKPAIEVRQGHPAGIGDIIDDATKLGLKVAAGFVHKVAGKAAKNAGKAIVKAERSLAPKAMSKANAKAMRADRLERKADVLSYRSMKGRGRR